MKFLKNRVLPVVCAFSVLISFLVVPASAGQFGSTELEFPVIEPASFWDADYLKSEFDRLFSDNSADSCAFVSEFAYIANKNNWAVTSKENLVNLAAQWNQTHASTYSVTALGVDDYTLDDGTKLSFIRMKFDRDGFGNRNDWTWCMNDGSGKILVALPDEDDSITARGQWLQVNQTSATRVEMLPHDVLFNAAQDLGCSLFRMGNYWVIKKTMGVTEYVYSNADGERFVAQYEEEKWATNQDRPQTNITEDGDIVEGDLIKNDIGIDLSGMTVTLPDGTLNLIDKLIYDESTKTYFIDSHDTYNTENNYYVTNNYSWTYHINYTSITYIGQTEEYNKYYEVYYELPDGRDSADLTKEDLEQLNLSIDVIPYGRSADDTSLRSLYHFDGDTKDSSYWNYCTDFNWNTGASLTYMDAGVFDGALYLDETEHDFTLTLPTAFTSGDFTVQWRYYQSYTATPQTDSYLQLGGVTVAQFDGANFLDYAGNTLCVLPIGTWNELALVRSNGVVYYYLNGVCVGSVAYADAFSKYVNFHFGNQQQTYKYLDELRVLNRSIAVSGADYEPTSVPHDTNLTLVLPDTVAPVADEYWSITHSPNYISYLDFTTGTIPDNLDVSNAKDSNGEYDLMIIGDCEFPQWQYCPDVDNLVFHDGYATLSRGSGSHNYSYMWYSGLHTALAQHSDRSGNTYYGGFNEGIYTVSILFRDGTIDKTTLDFSNLSSPSTTTLTGESKSWGYVEINCPRYDSALYYGFLTIILRSDASIDIVGIEVTPGDSSFSAEWVESVTAIDKDDLNTPTLAVRTDIDITSYQIGGVRPSIPEKGQVWAMVENDRIVSIQIYNGQAWEGVDGRIWTGQRWIPASSYNIITLQDMYDIVDATPNYEYIYSEAGFWAWWQKSWNAFTEKLFQTLGSGGSGNGCQHTYAIISESDPTCTDPGQRVFKCSLCENQYVESLPALGHDWIRTDEIPTTYTIPDGTACPDCAGMDYAAALDEDAAVYSCTCNTCDTVWTVPAIVTEGKTLYTCSRCGVESTEADKENSGFFDALGNFLADGVEWVTDKLKQLVDALDGLNDIFSDYVTTIREKVGQFPLFLGAALAFMPDDLMAVFWFSVIAFIILAVWKKWLR